MPEAVEIYTKNIDVKTLFKLLLSINKKRD